MRRSTGTTVSLNVTAALTGFPGAANASIRPVVDVFDGNSANVSGFPGFIITRPK